MFGFAGVLPTEYKLTVQPKAGSYIERITFAGRDITDGIFNPAPGGALSIEVGAARGLPTLLYHACERALRSLRLLACGCLG